MARPATADHLRSGKQPATKTVEIVLDPDVARAVHDAEARVEQAEARQRLNPDDEAAQDALWAAREELDALRAEAAKGDVVVAVKFRSIGRHAYDDLIRQHPPSEEQQAEAKTAGVELNFNPETFRPALVAVSMEEPKMALEDVAAMWDSPDWNAAELTALFNGAVEVNSRRVVLDLGKGSPGTVTTGPKSRGARSGASRTRSS